MNLTPGNFKKPDKWIVFCFIFKKDFLKTLLFFKELSIVGPHQYCSQCKVLDRQEIVTVLCYSSPTKHQSISRVSFDQLIRAVKTEVALVQILMTNSKEPAIKTVMEARFKER